MFKNAYRLPFKVMGIPIQLDVTFLIILPVFAWVIGSNIGQFIEMSGLEIDPARITTGATPYALGFATAIGLFVSVVIHEFGHATVGRAMGVRVKSVTLWLLGGVAQFESMPRGRGQEAWVAIAGPLTSMGLWAAFLGLWGILPADADALRFIAAYLSMVNLMLALFNLLPALPLDGGRVLRSLLALRLPHQDATRIAGTTSRVIAVVLGLAGFMSMNPMLILVAFFVFMAATSETTHARMQDALERVRATDVMKRDVETVSGDLPVGDLVNRMVEGGYLGYPVVDRDGRLIGMITFGDVKRGKALGRVGPDTRVADAMVAVDRDLPLSASAFDAFEKMAGNGYERVAVVDDEGRVRGIICMRDLLNLVEARTLEREFTPRR